MIRELNNMFKEVLPLPEKVYNLSINIPKEGIEVVREDGSKEVVKPIEEDIKDLFGILGSSVYFVDEKKETYAAPFCYDVVEGLSHSKYKKGDIFVPLFFSDTIVDEELNKRWEELSKLSIKNISESNTSKKR